MLGFVVGGPRSRVMNWSLDKTFIFTKRGSVKDEGRQVNRLSQEQKCSDVTWFSGRGRNHR